MAEVVVRAPATTTTTAAATGVAHPGRVCSSCGATKTPQWREGPMGPKTLCNACGVKRNRLLAKLRGESGAAAQWGGDPRTPGARAKVEGAQTEKKGAMSSAAEVIAAAAAASAKAVRSVSPENAAAPGSRKAPRRASAQRSMDALHAHIHGGQVNPAKVRRGSNTSMGRGEYSDTDDELRPPSPSPPTTSPNRNRKVVVAAAPGGGGGGPVVLGEETRAPTPVKHVTFEAATLLAMRHASSTKDECDTRFTPKNLSKHSVEELEDMALCAANDAVAAEAAVNAVAKVLALKQALMIQSRENHKAVNAALMKAKKQRRREGG